ncbi:MAG TPA: cytochrome c biogenesis protein ResB [Patescibacteria group bacterium]|nr:cytochrome c biogenesis protein ResB [Patescibacteria group bacterium]
MRRSIISYRFAVTVIAILFGTSAFGWILTELVPPDVPYQREIYRARWGDTWLWLVERLGLHDPFHTFWYRAVLALFFIVLVACLVSRWRSIVLRTFRSEPPDEARELSKRDHRLHLSWRELKWKSRDRRDVLDELEYRYGPEKRLAPGRMDVVFGVISSFLRGRGFRVSKTKEGGVIRFVAVAGRWRYFGNFLFHLGILVITVGGMVGSFWGETEILYGTDGDILPLGGTPYAILVDGFDVIMTDQMAVKEYISNVSIIDTVGNRLVTTTIEVNKPLRFDRYDILQSSYYVDEEAFRWARVRYSSGGNPVGTVVRLEPDEAFSLEGFPLVIRAKRFLPDFKIGPNGPYSETPNMHNPAIEVELEGEGGAQEGWLFLYYPRFNSRFDLPVQLSLVDVAPVYFTGLQISTNPGSMVLLAGIAAATIGLALLYIFNYRCLKGVMDAEGLILAGTGYRWKVSFREEFEKVSAGLVDALSDLGGGDA